MCWHESHFEEGCVHKAMLIVIDVQRSSESVIMIGTN